MSSGSGGPEFDFRLTAADDLKMAAILQTIAVPRRIDGGPIVKSKPELLSMKNRNDRILCQPYLE